MTLYLPRPYQPGMTKFELDLPRCNVFARMGAGKGVATLEAISTLLMFNEVRRVLILGPKRVAQHTWPGEAREFHESFGHLKIAAAVGTEKHRTEVVRSNPQILTINYDVIEWLINGYGDQWPFDMVVADESGRLRGHRVGMRTSVKGNEFLQGQGSVRAAALAKIAHKRVRRWVNLNGSPAPNGLQDLWGQCFFIDGGRKLGTSFSAFQQRWFRSFQNEDGRTMLEPFENAKQEIENEIREYTIAVDPRPFLNTRGLVEEIVFVDLPTKARRHYDELQKQLFTMLAEGKFVEAFNSGGRGNKCLQVANGAVIWDSETRAAEVVHDEKIEALKSIVSEANGENVLVRYIYTQDRDRILKVFPEFRAITDKNAQTDFEKGRLAGLVVHAASAGHGLSLQRHCRTLIDFGSDFNLEHDEQIVERIGPTRQAQSGQDRDVYRYRIVARNTIEETAVLPRLKYKMSVQDSLLAAMQRSQ